MFGRVVSPWLGACEMSLNLRVWESPRVVFSLPQTSSRELILAGANRGSNAVPETLSELRLC